MADNLKFEYEKQRAVAIILAIKGPQMPISEINSVKLGVNLKGTARFPFNSPAQTRQKS